jgi:NADPH:quinone reductase-like Zn-dependent oxidoreductase
MSGLLDVALVVLLLAYLVYGFRSGLIRSIGAIVGIVAGAGEPFNPAALIGNSARMQGLSVGSRAMFEAMCRAIELHRIQPIVDKVFPWTEARAAFEAMVGGAHFGKIVLEF